jgi:hypothetical protein
MYILLGHEIRIITIQERVGRSEGPIISGAQLQFHFLLESFLYLSLWPDLPSVLPRAKQIDINQYLNLETIGQIMEIDGCEDLPVERLDPGGIIYPDIH